MSVPFSQRTLEMLAEMKWSGPRPGCAALMEPKLRELGHVMLESAARFLDHFGYLTWMRESPYQPGGIAFHTDAVEAGIHIHPSKRAACEEQAKARLSPIGEAGYGSYVLLMDENERVFALDEAGVLTQWANSSEELIEELCSSAAWSLPLLGRSRRRL